MVTLTLLNAVSVENCLAKLNILSQCFSKNIAADEQPLAALGGGGRRRHRAD
jgi:hypothetical protein